MIKETLLHIFERDLLQLQTEIESYPDDDSLWLVMEGITNSAGNLCLHLNGNLKHFIGAVLCNNGYTRKREAEFDLKGIPKHALVADIEITIEIVKAALESMNEDDFFKTFPTQKHGETVSTDFMLLHLLSHFNYHLGQINYHRRLLTYGIQA